MRNRLTLALLVATLPALSCTETATTPTPAATPTPAPTPTPTPAAVQPTPSPAPPPEESNEPAVYATAGVHSIRRKGKLLRTPPNVFQPGDALYLNCTPRDAKGNKTQNHGNIRYWNIFSKDLTVGLDFHYTDTNSFNPDLHIHNPISVATGTLKAQCVVANLPHSNVHNMPVKR